jgi:hypothetical protein
VNKPHPCAIALAALLILTVPAHAQDPGNATAAWSNGPTEQAGNQTTALAIPQDEKAPRSREDQEKAEEDKETDASQEEEQEDSEEPPVKVEYRGGLRIDATNGKFGARIRWRAQMRYTGLTSDDIAGEDDGIEEQQGFRIQRARFKIDGHAYTSWLKYYLEFSLARPAMLTFRFDLAPKESFGVRLGQYMAVYNRERLDSSGAQQFADRSIVNSPFTVDRQQGVTALGRLFPGTLGDLNYAGAIFTGTGRGGALEGDRRPMFVGRLQWNFLGRLLPFTQSDVARRGESAGSFAVAGMSNIGQYTRWSSSGGGQLPGFEPGTPDQYKVDQWMLEFAYHGHGLSVQAEYHQKKVEDRVNQEITELDGWYAEAGYFFHEAIDVFPEPLELAFRLARVNDEEGGVDLPTDREATFGGNWFLNGHNNKITVDTSFLKNTLPGGSEDSGWRLRGQWDIQF